jgi:hypothetical protein
MTDIDDQIITPDVWGPHAWKFIHYVTLGYPENPTPYQKVRYKTFLLLLQDVLPCYLCAEHFKETLQTLPLTDDILNSRENFIKWGINIHNVVNEMKNKPILKYIDAIKIIDTDVQCKPNIIEIIKNKENSNLDSKDNKTNKDNKDNKDNKIEPFNEIETFNEVTLLDTPKNNSKLLIKQEIPVNLKLNNMCDNNINTVYGLICIFIALIFIAIIYKKK